MTLSDADKDLSPSPARLVESLRDTGYSFNAAVADIIDNSISANSTDICLDLVLEFDGNLKLYIADNGDGMDESELLNAMKYGSKKRNNPKSLGKFGMGLKTASTSFCRSLTVISRKNEKTNVRCWDIDEIIRVDQWKLMTPELDIDDMKFLDSISKKNGTLIVWDKIDRLVRSVDGSPDRKQIDKFTESLIDHLDGVFFRFISSKDSPVKIKVNGRLLKGWDPFCSWLKDLEVESKTMKIENNAEFKGTFDFKVYILPNKSQMTKEEEDRARYGLDNQGFHVYRENRLIYSGGWLNRMFVYEPHFNLLRVEISFSHELDEFFQIDIKKSNISLPHNMKEVIKSQLVPLRREAERRYRGAIRRGTGSSDTNIHTSSNIAIDKKIDDNVGSELRNVDSVANTALVRNAFGETVIKIPVRASQKAVVQAENSLDHGVLWNYSINQDQKHSVLLNQGHEFYRRVYLSKHSNPTMILAMDSVFWSLAEAELTTINEKAKKNLEELRFKVSRILEDLASELPELTEEENMVNNEK